ncbi:MAG: hypothetical protein NC432_05915 [Roseburia sp.]|nr:hypothetical protein [Roseburia sp.]MCM1098841.1 hypothetical protein [Ruminococcus flavefaciens]
MWDVTLRILSVIGIIALLLLGLLLLLALLVLFCPVGYRLQGKKTPEELWASARASWLFGILRLCYSYPEPGSLTVKVLWMTVFDSSRRKEKPEKAQKRKKAEESGKPGEAKKAAKPEEPENPENAGEDASGKKDRGDGSADREGSRPADRSEAIPEEVSKEKSKTGGETADAEAAEASGETESPAGKRKASEKETSTEAAAPASDDSAGILEKIGKIKYTIQKNCDKIKEIWGNLSYYARLCQEENTAQLWRHAMLRLAKILKSIRPRKIRADILFGAAAPDTTGHVYGLYCMLSLVLGESVVVTPDFTRAILQGEAELSGHITGGVLAWNGLKLLLDRKLHVFLKKMKAGRKRDGR